MKSTDLRPCTRSSAGFTDIGVESSSFADSISIALAAQVRWFHMGMGMGDGRVCVQVTSLCISCILLTQKHCPKHCHTLLAQIFLGDRLADPSGIVQVRAGLLFPLMQH